MTGYSVLSTAVSGLTAAQRGMDITSQNITNSNTPGYSRQLVKLDSVAPSLVASFYTGGNSTVVGGVQLDAVVRVRDAFLEGTRVAAGSSKSALDAQSAALSGIETLVNEPSDSSLSAGLGKFYSSWSALATNVNSSAAAASAAGQVVLQQGANVASQLNLISGGLSAQWTTQQSSLTSTVGALNDAAKALASLNGQIVASSASTGQPVNELLDKRDLLIRKLGELGGGVASIQPDGTATVAVGGATIVHETSFTGLKVGGAGALSDVAANPPVIQTTSGSTISVSSGKAAGLMAAISIDIPAIATQLNDTAAALISAVNQVHSAGYTLDGDPGGDFFRGTDANDIGVVLTSTSQLAVSDVAGTVSGANASRISELANDSTSRDLLGDAGALERWRVLASGLGSKIQGLDSATSVQKTILDSADAAVESDAGVNLDEEMTNLLMYQRAYQAAAKVITAIDEMMDTLINRTGI